jgi:hypothetical protein
MVVSTEWVAEIHGARCRRLEVRLEAQRPLLLSAVEANVPESGRRTLARARSGRVGSRTPGSQQEQHAQRRATRRLFTSSAEAEDHDSAEADDEDSAESGAPPDLEAGMHELHAELGKDWILRFLSRATTLR